MVPLNESHWNVDDKNNYAKSSIHCTLIGQRSAYSNVYFFHLFFGFFDTFSFSFDQMARCRESVSIWYRFIRISDSVLLCFFFLRCSLCINLNVFVFFYFILISDWKFQQLGARCEITRFVGLLFQRFNVVNITTKLPANVHTTLILNCFIEHITKWNNIKELRKIKLIC